MAIVSFLIFSTIFGIRSGDSFELKKRWKSGFEWKKMWRNNYELKEWFGLFSKSVTFY